MSAAVEVRKLSRRYGRRWALADVTLEVGSGETVIVAGRNGSGKSTLLRVLATAIRPDFGSVRVAGFDVREEREDVRRRVALLSHHSYLYESLTPHENLEVAARLLRSSLPLMPLLARVGLESRAHDPVFTFSAGMRKRLSLARVLLQEPDVILLDEPYGQLDPPGFALIDSVVRESKARGATVIMATHQLGRGAALAKRAFVLEAGRLAWTGPAAEAGERGRISGDDAWS
jgi:heme exporter protein A